MFILFIIHEFNHLTTYFEHARASIMKVKHLYNNSDGVGTDLLH